MPRAIAVLAVLAGCYAPPDLATTPYETPILDEDGDDGLYQVCLPERRVVVARTLDGDTVELSRPVASPDDEALDRVRLLGLNAPETSGTAECFGAEAATALSRLVSASTVTLAFDRTCVDVFGERLLGYLWLDRAQAERLLAPEALEEVLELHQTDDPDDDADAPVLINTVLLLQGMACMYPQGRFEDARYEIVLRAAQRLARVRGTGLWGACDTIPAPCDDSALP